MTPKPPTRAHVLTPAGTGAIGVVRVQGLDAGAVLARVFRARESSRGVGHGAGRLRYGQFLDGEETIDDVIISPAGVGGDDGFDISAHGGVRVMERILETLGNHGAPLVPVSRDDPPLWPSFGHLADEAVQAAARAQTDRAVLFLARTRTRLPAALKRLAATSRERRGETRAALAGMIDRSQAARALIDGATVALIGPPNSGKSTLFNRLLGRSAVIISPRAGTTRDWVSASISIQGIPLTLVDTAGIRTPSDALEDQAIRAGQSVVAEAGARLFLVDGSAPDVPLSVDDGETIGQGPGLLCVINKTDQGVAIPEPRLRNLSRSVPICRISARTGTGVDNLIEELLRTLGFDGWRDDQPCFFSQRQVDLAKGALSALDNDGMAEFDVMIDGLLGL